MNARREAFCRAYARCGVGAQAAREAGYSPNGANSKASDLLANISVRERVEALKAEYQAEEDRRHKEAQDAINAAAAIAVATLIEVAQDIDASDGARVSAANALLEMGRFGKDSGGPQLIQIVGGLPLSPT
jgi:hypothetical protein